ncbi:hypothetical protein I2I05_09685 [Hymenobacter sp. BT683]|uniref:Lipoprotein n=1 Tax=Hymenobacter jeongseonensis TaxID=2791027 RepID=A0ABS0IIN9_9BACT|nr:hypothetical protein [Hymenobacter jeongseonensis]MBF9237665.1 hypothetical protein [Hymenobacter jeongseonensis]
MKSFLPHRLAFFLVGTLGLIHCQPNAEQNARFSQASTLTDTIEVTSYSFERENSAALADWKGFQDGDEFIALPPDWRDTVQGQTLVIAPGKNQGGYEVLTFARFDREGDNRAESERLGQQAARSAFSPFAVRGDTLKELVFERGFGYERNADLAKQGTDYQGYCLLYANDSTFYKYTLILSKQRLRAYDGNLISDIVGNLKIGNKYVFRTENPVQKIIVLNP